MSRLILHMLIRILEQAPGEGQNAQQPKRCDNVNDRDMSK